MPTCQCDGIESRFDEPYAAEKLTLYRDSGPDPSTAALLDALRKEDLTGRTLLDIGGLNVSDRSTVQLGFVNVTDEIKGFQFGFVNIASNGFLPFFPIFNFPKGPTSPSTEPQPRPERRAPGQFDQ